MVVSFCIRCSPFLFEKYQLSPRPAAKSSGHVARSWWTWFVMALGYHLFIFVCGYGLPLRFDVANATGEFLSVCHSQNKLHGETIDFPGPSWPGFVCLWDATSPLFLWLCDATAACFSRGLESPQSPAGCFLWLYGAVGA